MYINQFATIPNILLNQVLQIKSQNHQSEMMAVPHEIISSSTVSIPIRLRYICMYGVSEN